MMLKRNPTLAPLVSGRRGSHVSMIPNYRPRTLMLKILHDNSPLVSVIVCR